ncbi:MAG: SufS family cysteine desulfurase [Mariniblastus sp.]|nr:SufS family cysteine desulfurase [Mariniblastus sp.]
MSEADSAQLDVTSIRQDFPILSQTIHRDRPLIYFDNGASSQHPQIVVQAMVDCYEKTYANVHRGIHWLSEQSSEQYEHARQVLGGMIGARRHHEVIFTSGTTAGINLVAHAWGNQHLKSGDEIVLTILEHHSNIVPWQQLAERTGAIIKFVGLTAEGYLDLEGYRRLLNDRTRLVAITAVSNVLGTFTPVTEMVSLAHDAGARVLVDAAQHIPHEPVNVADWDADFVVFSGHKMVGPTGIGVLWAKEELLETMPPFLGGGSMISQVTTDGFTPGELPAKFEAGTPPIVQAIGLGAAAEYLQSMGLRAISRHERALTDLAHQELMTVEGLEILGPATRDKSGIVSFVIEGLSNQDISLFLDRQGVAIRAGHHCAMPLHDYLDIRNSCRASFYLYNTNEEVRMFVKSLKNVVAKLR